MYDTVVVRYGEIFLKGEYVRKRFEDLLIKNIKKRLQKTGIEFRIYRSRHRIYLETGKASEVCELLKTVFGVVSLSPAVKTTSALEDIKETCMSLAEKILRQGDTFAVRVQRTGTHPYKSKDVEEVIGRKILESFNVKVDLENPQKVVYIEVRDEEAYIYDHKIKGLGGLPYGSQGTLVALLSTGIDSPVASWTMMRRGCRIIALHFGELGEVSEIIKTLESYCNEEIPVITVDRHKILEKIHEKSGKYTCILCKRFMYKTAEALTEIAKASGIVTGENIGQVASQTLENLYIIDDIRTPVYRPLAGMDKEDIITISKEIGTYKHAKNIKCPYIPPKPATKADPEVIHLLESELKLTELLEDVRNSLILGKR